MNREIVQIARRLGIIFGFPLFLFSFMMLGIIGGLYDGVSEFWDEVKQAWSKE